MATTLGGVDVVEGAQNNVEIQNLARFAVQEHNKKETSALEFVRVISAKKQVVAGFMYYITLEAADGVKKQIYEAKVWDKPTKPGSHSKELQEFKLVGDDGANAPSVSST